MDAWNKYINFKGQKIPAGQDIVFKLCARISTIPPNGGSITIKVFESSFLIKLSKTCKNVSFYPILYSIVKLKVTDPFFIPIVFNLNLIMCFYGSFTLTDTPLIPSSSLTF